MDITIYPKKLSGCAEAIPSKSQAHRLLLCAAFADRQTVIRCPQTNRDMDATADCLRAIGVRIEKSESAYTVDPIGSIPEKADLFCGESGSTLRFLLPVVGALGIDATIHMEGRLPQRPLSPLWEEMERMGCVLSRPDSYTVRCAGKLQPGIYTIDGGVSSQFITGLLFACSLLDGESRIVIENKLESAPYVNMTLQAMELFGVQIRDFHIPGRQIFKSPGSITVEGDWSNAAFFLAANALGSEIALTGLAECSAQGDRAIKNCLMALNQNTTIDATDIPDLVPILSVVAAAKHGAVFTGIRRLRLKESDRVAAVIALLEGLGCHAKADENTLTVYPGSFRGGCIDAWGDHRIAMSAAIAATAAEDAVSILGAQCVSKSYPAFWEIYNRLGGHYEQYIR